MYLIAYYVEMFMKSSCAGSDEHTGECIWHCHTSHLCVLKGVPIAALPSAAHLCQRDMGNTGNLLLLLFVSKKGA